MHFALYLYICRLCVYVHHGVGNEHILLPPFLAEGRRAICVNSLRRILYLAEKSVKRRKSLVGGPALNQVLHAHTVRRDGLDLPDKKFNSP